jgi:glycosyltransferase involved in cell wall biosynthesis
VRIAVLGARGFPSTYGGYETFVRHFVPHAIYAGHDIIVYCRWSQSGVHAWHTHGAECRATRGINTKSLSTLTFGLTSFWDLRRASADCALVVNCANGLWLPVLRQTGPPVVINVDGLEWERGKWNRLGRATFRTGARMAAHYADALVADSLEISRIWHADFGVRPHFIPYGAPIVTEAESDAVTSLGIPLGVYGLTVARLVPENNVDLTLDALDGMGSDRPPWVVVGSAGGRSDVEDRLRTLSRQSDFWWLGHVSDQTLLTQLWHHCAVYVHGHSVGGTNPALLQAMGAGAATLAFDTPFAREVLTNSGAFYVDATSLAASLRLLITSPDARKTLSELGRRRIETTYNWHDVCNRYLKLLEAIRSRPGGKTTSANPNDAGNRVAHGGHRG